jgi:hypothetical protein
MIVRCLDTDMWAGLDKKGCFLKHDEIVIIEENIKIEFDYPLQNVFTFDFVSSGGFTRKHLVELIAKTYQQIYQEEDQSSQVQVIPMENRTTLLNRNQTNGKYGIWGHDISDLWLEGIHYNTSTNTVLLDIGS